MRRYIEWLGTNRKKIRIISHIIMVVALVNIALAVLTGSFEASKDFHIISFFTQLVTFFIIQTVFAEEA